MVAILGITIGSVVFANDTPAPPDDVPYCPYAGPDASGLCCAANETLVGNVCVLTVIGESLSPRPTPPTSPPGGNGGGTGSGGGEGADEGAPAGEEASEGEEAADESPGCWESLVDGETEVTSGFRTVGRPNHKGVDLRCPTGRNVYAAEAGTVTRIPNDNMAEGTYVEAGQPGSGGNMIVVTYESGREGEFMHLLPRNRQGVMVHEGDEVAAGELLGACNDTGHSEDPHLHYELMENGQHVDPVQGHDCE